MTVTAERIRCYFDRLAMDGVCVPDAAMADLKVEFSFMGPHVDRVNASVGLLFEPSTVQTLDPLRNQP